MPTIAIVGRPNVGKSALFNRLAGRQIAIVHDQPGVTRDRISAKCALTENAATLIDTGGIGSELDDGFTEQVAVEADIAITAADIILFVVDAREGVTVVDDNIARLLRKASSKVIPIANKADHTEQESTADEFSSLGFGSPLATSAAHGRGLQKLVEALDARLATMKSEDETQLEEAREELDKGLKVALVGRPNVGKSSLVNAILQDDRTIVSDIAGTTRDAVDLPYTFNNEDYILIDTAGLRPRQRMDTSVEVFSAMRTEKAIRRADICLLVIDCAEGVSAMDRKIAKQIQKEEKACIIVLNKFDLYHPGAPMAERLEEIEEHVRRELFFLHYAPFVCTSALKGQSLDKIFGQIQKVRQEAQNPISTGQLNRFLTEAFIRKPPSGNNRFKKRLKLLYATAAVNDRYTAIPVPTYILFVNDKRLMHESYQQYLSNRLRERHHAPGIPIIFSVRSRNRK